MKKNSKVSIAIINHNTSDLLPECIKSLEGLDYANKEIIMIDQDSTDNSVEVVHKKFPKIRVIENQNTGYAGGANKAYEVTDGEFLFVMNPDIKLNKDYITVLVNELKNDSKIGAITGKFLQYDFKNKKKKDVLDTTGLLAFKNRRVVDRAQGMKDKGQFEKKEEVFGISGCAAMYRRAALKDIEGTHSCGVEVWDYDFFMYKEDIDVSWRLNLNGWKCLYIPKAVGYHGRGTGVLKRYTNSEVIKHRKSVSKLARYHSYKNQRLMQIKNETPRDILLSLPTIIWKEILVFGYMLLFEPFTFFKSFSKFLILLPRALKKRKYIQKNREIDSMKHFLTGKPEDVFESWK